jgi:hypothetical protein
MSSSAARMARTRQRRRAGLILLEIEAPEVELVETLIVHGMLDPNLADDPEAIAAAVERTLEALIAEWRATPGDMDRG